LKKDKIKAEYLPTLSEVSEESSPPPTVLKRCVIVFAAIEKEKETKGKDNPE
jgi:hypothetical protein